MSSLCETIQQGDSVEEMQNCEVPRWPPTVPSPIPGSVTATDKEVADIYARWQVKEEGGDYAWIMSKA